MEAFAVGVRRVAAAEGRHGEVDEDPIGEKHHAEKGEEAHQHMAAFDAVSEPDSFAHRSGPRKVALCWALPSPATSVTTRENSVASLGSLATAFLSRVT